MYIFFEFVFDLVTARKIY